MLRIHRAHIARAAAASALYASAAARAVPVAAVSLARIHACIPARALHCSIARSVDQPPHNSYLRAHDTPQRAPDPPPSAQPLVRERDRPVQQNDTSAAVADAWKMTDAELVAHQNREMDRATRRQRNANARARRSGKDWRSRADEKRQRTARVALPTPPPIYFPAPFTLLPVIPAPRETLESALIRVDKVPKSPGFGKEVGRIRGQLAKYNFTARRQLEVAELEFATKLADRIALFPTLRKKHSSAADGSGAMVETETKDPFAAQLHPYDHALIELSYAGGGSAYNSLLNHCRNLVQKLRGAAKKGLSGLNHSGSMDESRKAHKEAIYRMKDLWVKGDPPSPETGGSGQRSGMELVTELRSLSRLLRHIPAIHFERNLLDVKRHVASYLSVLPQEFLFLPREALTFEKLRPFLPPSPEYTFSLVGAPNVGKSSILAALSNAKVEVRDFAFTTTSLQVGHLQREEQDSPSMLRREAMNTSASQARKVRERKTHYPQPEYTPAVPLTRVQLVDTPGLLFRPDALRKPVEKLTLSLCAHVQPLVLAFVMDATGASGSGVRVQRFLLREMRQRFSFHTPPHPAASDVDPRNHEAHDALYANVAADAELQGLTRQLQSIPWMLLRSKSDLTKREHIKDEVLARSSSGAEREVREIEKELAKHNEALLAEVNDEQETEGEAAQGMNAPGTDDPAAAGSASSSSSALIPSTSSALTTPAPAAPRMDRAAWKMHAIREHMKKYLARADGTFDLGAHDGEEEVEVVDAREMGAGLRQLAASTSASTAGPLSRLPPLPSLSLSVESGAGLAELAEHIWFEVDRRESLRLEKCYKEMRARILWIRGEQTGSQDAQEAEDSDWQRLQEAAPQQQLHAHADASANTAGQHAQWHA